MTETTTDEKTNESGFGLVEIIVALFMLAILAVAFLPLLIQGLQLSANNATRATATQILHDRLEFVRTQSTTCSTIKSAVERTEISPVQDPRGISFQVKTVVATCPTGAAAAIPGTIGITIEVRRADALTETPLAQAKTLVFIK